MKISRLIHLMRFASVSFFSFAAALTANALVLAERGQPCACAIEVKASGESANYAAQEFAAYVEKQTGVRIPVGGAAARRIVLEPGDAALGDDGFEIVGDGAELHIHGGRRGVLYGVYEVLERFGGVGFFTSWHEVVPRLERFEVPDGTRIREKPAFEIRDPYWTDAINHPEFAAKIRKNGDISRPIPERFGGMMLRYSKVYGGHSFDLLMPPKEFGKAHAEYYSEVKGVRKVENSQLCMTNPDVVRIVTERLREQMRREPDADVFSLQPNDRFDYCTCSNCQAVIDEEGSTSGPYVRFAQTVADGLAGEFPDKLVRVSSYQWYRRPPKKFRRYAKNILFGFAPIECDYSMAIDESPYWANVDSVDDLKAWAKIASGSMRLWDYSTWFMEYPAAFPNFNAIRGNLLWYRKIGVKHVYNEGQYRGYGAWFSELKAWLGGKLMWNPDRELKPLVDRFLVGYYGKAAPYVRQYLELIESQPRDPAKSPLCCEPYGAKYGIPDYPEVLSDSVADEALRIWDQAEGAVQDDGVFLGNVRIGKFAAAFSWLKHRCPVVLATESLPEAEKCRDVARWMVDFVETSPRVISICEGKLADDIRKTHRYAQWKRLAKGGVAACADGTVEDDALFGRFYKTRWVERVRDASACNGWAARMKPVYWAWCLQLKAKEVAADEGVRYRVRVRARAEFRKGASRRGVALSGGYSARGGKAKSFRCNIPSNRITGEYDWYDLGEWTPSQAGDSFFWLAVGEFDKKLHAEHPDVTAVLIDQFAIEREAGAFGGTIGTCIERTRSEKSRGLKGQS